MNGVEKSVLDMVWSQNGHAQFCDLWPRKAKARIKSVN